MKLLVIGSGGREHALVWRLVPRRRRHRRSSAHPATPASPATPAARTCRADRPRRPGRPGARRAVSTSTIVGPELPLAVGIADRFAAEGLAAARAVAARRPNSRPARCSRRPSWPATASRPHATGLRVAGRREAGRRGTRRCPVVVKADGLAAGKGVVDCAGPVTAATRPSTAPWSGAQFGDAGERPGHRGVHDRRQKRRSSRSATATARCQLASAQDHKRVIDDDQGPNTGGMGAFAPSPRRRPRQVEREVLARDRRARARRHGGGRHALRRVPLRRPDDHARGPEGRRVQRAVR